MRRVIKLLTILTRPEYIVPLIKGIVPGIEHERFLRNIDCKYLVDIGANRGQFTIVAKKIFPEIKVHAFEPLAEPGDIFSSFFGDDSSIELHRIAIGPKNQVATIHISAKDHSSSLLPIGDKQVDLFPYTYEVDQCEVPIRSLEDVLDREEIKENALIKIDVQGYELEVLKGCESLLGSFEHVYVECSFVELYHGQAFAQDIISYLETRRFGLCGFYNVYYSKEGETIQADLYFSKKTDS